MHNTTDLCLNVTPDRVFYYGCDDVRDHGWGCVYRSAQTLMHALDLHPVPHILDLVHMAGIPETARGRDRWIEPVDVQFMLSSLGARRPDLIGLALNPRRMLRTSRDEFDHIHATWRSFHDHVLAHLQQHRVPVLVDDGVVGLCISGYHGNVLRPDEGHYVLIDPHETRAGSQVHMVSVRAFYRSSPMLMALVFPVFPAV